MGHPTAFQNGVKAIVSGNNVNIELDPDGTSLIVDTNGKAAVKPSTFDAFGAAAAVGAQATSAASAAAAAATAAASAASVASAASATATGAATTAAAAAAAAASAATSANTANTAAAAAQATANAALVRADNLSDVPDKAAARSNLQLGTAALQNGTAAQDNVPVSGNAAGNEVVKGDDSRLGGGGAGTVHYASEGAYAIYAAPSGSLLVFDVAGACYMPAANSVPVGWYVDILNKGIYPGSGAQLVTIDGGEFMIDEGNIGTAIYPGRPHCGCRVYYNGPGYLSGSLWTVENVYRNTMNQTFWGSYNGYL